MELNQQIRNFLKEFPQLSKLSLASISLATFGLLNVCTQSAIANDYVGNKGIEFEEDTIVEFEFIESHGAYQSTFGIIELDSCQTDIEGAIIFETCVKTPLLAETKPSDSYQTVFRRSTYEDNLNRANDDFIGTPGNTVLQPTTEFAFQAGERYAFYLESYYEGKLAGVVYSVDFFNTQNNRQALFNEELPATQLASRRNIPQSETNQFESLVSGGLLLRFDDTGSTLVKDEYQDVDFDDFVVGIGGYESCLYPDAQTSVTEE